MKQMLKAYNDMDFISRFLKNLKIELPMTPVFLT
jgi:hypothetical protein